MIYGQVAERQIIQSHLQYLCFSSEGSCIFSSNVESMTLILFKMKIMLNIKIEFTLYVL